VLLTAASAGAQTAKPESAADAASAAMERAKRQAAGPMRVILEASKSRRKNAEADSPSPSPSPSPSVGSPPTADSSLRAVASRSAATMPTLAATPAPAPNSAPTWAAVPAPAPAAQPAVVAAPPPATLVTQITLNSEALQGKGAAAPVPGLEGMAAAPVGLGLLAGAAALPALGAGPTRVRLINRVDPDLGPRQLDDLGRNAVVNVELTIRADGTVGAVALVPPTPRGIQRAVVAALEQWRFEPLPSERLHRVQLLFNRE